MDPIYSVILVFHCSCIKLLYHNTMYNITESMWILNLCIDKIMAKVIFRSILKKLHLYQLLNCVLFLFSPITCFHTVIIQRGFVHHVFCVTRAACATTYHLHVKYKATSFITSFVSPGLRALLPTKGRVVPMTCLLCHQGSVRYYLPPTRSVQRRAHFQRSLALVSTFGVRCVTLLAFSARAHWRQYLCHKIRISLAIPTLCHPGLNSNN